MLITSKITTAITILGGADNDTIYNDYSDSVSIDAGDGNDSINNYNNSSQVTIDGGAGNDSILNSASNVTINGGTDNDYIYNKNSNVKIDGGDGNDSIYSEVNNGLTLRGGNGNDIISLSGNYYWNNSFTISGDKGDDTVYAGEHEITYQLKYEDGNNLIYSQTNNTISVAGGYYYSTLKTGSSYVVSIYGGGSVTVRGGETPKVIGGKYSTVPPDKNVTESSDFMEITGDYGNDTITSSGNDTTIHAGKGDDIIKRRQCSVHL